MDLNLRSAKVHHVFPKRPTRGAFHWRSRRLVSESRFFYRDELPTCGFTFYILTPNIRWRRIKGRECARANVHCSLREVDDPWLTAMTKDVMFAFVVQNYAQFMDLAYARDKSATTRIIRYSISEYQLGEGLPVFIFISL